MKATALLCLLVCIAITSASSQKLDSLSIESYTAAANGILKSGLTRMGAYKVLKELTSKVGARLSGSPQAAKAVEWGRKVMGEMGFQNVHLEPVMVPHWVRGPVEDARLLGPRGINRKLHICALGGSIATPPGGVTGEVIEVKSFEQLRALGDSAKGKIVFFNRPFDQTKFNTFEAYGGAVDQRGRGAVEAAKVGGVAAIVRSMSSRIDYVPHTGAMQYVDSVTKIPTAAVSTRDADIIDSLLASGEKVMLRLKLSCKQLPDVESANVVGELVGTEHPEEVIVVGGHLDSWDKGQGAHDDGAGCAQSIEALRLLKEMALKPRRTIRAVLFMNEENGLAGGKAYAAKDRPGEKPIAAIETDAGGFTPRGFGVQADSEVFEKIARWDFLFKGMDADRIVRGGGGADISPLARKGIPMIGLRVDEQRYFDYHHSDSDTFDKVNERELELGAIAISILSYTLAQEGI